MNIAVIASEAIPFAQTGGLADVAGTLPAALERLGHSVSLFLPAYRRVHASGVPIRSTGVSLRIPIGTRVVEGSVATAKLPGSNVDVYLIEQPRYFDREQLYQMSGDDFPDNCERFVFFCRAVLETIRLLRLPLDALQCNDWQTGLIPVYLREVYREDESLARVGTLFTIHNLAYQGDFWHGDMALTGLDWGLFNWQHLECNGRLNLVKAGLLYADLISTVSPTYALEIQTREFGRGLDGVLRDRRDDLRGIVNGIDPKVWSPEHERMIAARYNEATVELGKADCKLDLQRLASLPERPEVPLFAQIGRLDPQKGWDLLAEVADDLLRGDVQLVVLGEGQPRYHELLDRLEAEHPGKVRAFLGFSVILAHQIEAGADLFLMPSLFEPCGLNQLYSLAHGTVPIVRATGGLADTVVDATPGNLADGTATGFAFDEPTPAALRAAIDRALALWTDRPAWGRLVRSGMRADWSWGRSARAYEQLLDEARRRASANATRRKTMGTAI